jgi:hypothetical protein
MARIKLSKEAAMKAITYSNDARDQLRMNISVMDNNVNSQFSGLQDPAFERYLEMSGQMQDLLKQISGKMDEISQYCESVIRWIDSYSEN